MADRFPSKGWTEFTVMHPTGRIDGRSTATSFGPTGDLHEALTRLAVADSDCLCDKGQHVLVTRWVSPPTSWTVAEIKHDESSKPVDNAQERPAGNAGESTVGGAS